MMGPVCLSLALPFLLGATQEDLPPGWKSVASKEGRFTVAMPGMPTETKKTVKTATGRLHVTVLTSEGRHDSLFVVSFSEFPEADLKKVDLDKRLDNARDGAASSAGGKVRSEKKIDVDRHPGREVVIEKDGTVVVKMRIFLVKHRLYQVMVLGTGTVFSARDVGIFLDSFRLNK